MRIAVIPARAGSKRIPGKNTRIFNHKPMIVWSIEAAIASGCFDKIIVSTDSKKTARIAIRHGAEVPFLRPKILSDDYTGTTAVIRHSTKWFTQEYSKPDHVCCIYATAPFITPDDILRGLKTIEQQQCDYSFSVTPYAFPVQRAIRLHEGRVSMLDEKQFLTRSQDLEEIYHDAAQFYWGTADAWLKEKTIFSKEAAPIILPRNRVIDIDTLDDWEFAENLFKAHQIMNSRQAA